MTRWRTRHRGSHAERGAAAVEFAIVLVVLLLIIFAIIDFGRLLFVSQSMKAASREGARAGVVASTPAPTGATVYGAADNAGASAAALAGGTLVVSVNGVPVQSSSTGVALCGGAQLTVTAATDFRWFTPVGIFSSNVNSVSADTTMRCE